MRRPFHLLAVVVAAAGLMIGGPVAPASAAPSQPAAACSWYSANLDPGSAQIVNPVSGFSGIAMRDGPWSYCTLITRVPWGHWVTLDCYIADGQSVSGVTSWSRVRYSNGGPVSYGWIADYHLSGRGSNYRC